MSMAFDVGVMRDGTVVGGGAKGVSRMIETDLFGEPIVNGHKSVLAQTFEYPPFSVLNAREGWWQERKRQWLALGIQSELGRGGGADTQPGTSHDSRTQLLSEFGARA